MINIDQLTESELTELNHRVVARLRLLHEISAHTSMIKFRVGEEVSFISKTGQAVVGVITRYNKKTVTVLTKDGHRWNVTPCFLRSADQSFGGPFDKNVVSVQHKR